MKMDRRLNVVLEVTRDDGSSVFVHSTPISRDIYQQHFLVLTKTVTRMYEEGLSPGMCSRVALLMLRKMADEMGISAEVESTLLPEIWRLTNVVVSEGQQGWTTLPLKVAIDRSIISEDDVDEVQNALTFFIAASWIHKRKELEESIYPMLKLSGSQVVSSNSTEYANSLLISTPVENTGETATPSPIPS